MPPRLVPPTASLHRSFVGAMGEFEAEGLDPVDAASLVGELDLGDERGFAAYVAVLIAQSLEDAPRPAGWVPATILWWVDGPDFLGRLAIRHRLTPGLREIGGHIGYAVRPSARRRGHATAMLAAALPIAHQLGIDPALVTCDVTNIGSRKVIEANGGVLEDERGGKRRYWVPTGPR
jgi:predicted acetyltransferase